MGILQGLCAFGNGLYAAWKGESDDDRLFYTSFSGGTWSGAQTIPGNSSIGPALATVGETIYAAWKGEQDDERLFYSALNAGKWTAQNTIPGNSSVGPTLAAFKGSLFAAWKGEQFDQRLFYSSYDGSAWSAQQQIPSVASSVGPSLAQYGDKLYAAWKGEDSDQGLYWASFDGSSWSGQTQIPGVGSSVGPSLASFGGKLYAAWKGIRGDEGLYFSAFDGRAWSPQQRIAGVGSSLGPALAAAGDALYAMWKGENDQRLWFAAFAGSSWGAQATLPGNTGQDPIRFIWIPDIHLEQNGQPGTWTAQSKWINQNQPAYHLQGILSAGDVQISSPGQDDLAQDMPPAWSEGFSVVAATGKPWLVTVGNHDFDDPFDTTNFDQYICHDRIDENPWYVGYWDAPGVTPIPVPGSPPAPSTGNPSKATQAIAFSVGARQILVVAVEQFPRQGALDWAASVIASHPTFDVIFLTHSYMTMAGNLYTVNGNDYGAFAPSETYNPGFRTGVQINEWLKTQPNVLVTLCGHDIPPSGTAPGTGQNVSHRVDTAADGHAIVGIYADYQFTLPPAQLPSQVVLLLELGEKQVNVRAFNTTTNQELGAPWYPFALP